MGEGDLVAVLIICGLALACCIGYLIKFFNKIASTEQDARAEQARQAAEARAQAEEEAHQDELRICATLRSRCESRGITDITTPQSRGDMLMIAETLGIRDEREAVRIYRLIEHEPERQAAKRKAHRREQWRREKDAELQNPAQQKALMELRGKEKYLHELQQRLTESERDVKNIDSLTSALNASFVPTVTPQKSDWAAWGGFVEGATGSTAAGLATAMEIQRENARAEREAAEYNANALQQHQKLMRDIAGVRNTVAQKNQPTIDSLSHSIGLIEGKLVNEGHTGELWERLTVTPQLIAKSPYGNPLIVARCSVTVDGPIEVLGSPASLDGSLHVIIKDAQGKVIAEGYHCPPGFGVADLRKVGFAMEKTFDAVCEPLGEMPTDVTNLTCEVTPHDLWAIEQ